MAVLVVAEHDNRLLNTSTLHAVTAASRFGVAIDVLVVGYMAASVTAASTRVAGVVRVLSINGPWLEAQLAEDVAAQVLGVAGEYSAIVFPATARGNNVASRVAALLNVAQICDVTRIVSRAVFEQSIFAGNVVATVESCDPTKVLTVRTTAFDAAPANGGLARTVLLSAVTGSHSPRLVESELGGLDRPERFAAATAVSGGRGLGSIEKLDAASASRFNSSQA